MALTLAELARHVGGSVRGDPETRIEAVAPLGRAEGRDIAFLSDPRYLPLLESTRAGAVILALAHTAHFRGPMLVVDDPHVSFARIAQLLHPPHNPRAGIDPSATVDTSARIPASASVGSRAVVEQGVVLGEHVVIGPGCYLGAGVRIGDDTRLDAHVVVMHGCRLGRRCLAHPGAVIGADGFGYARDGERWLKVPQLGRVLIEDDVELGANSTIDRGALDDTVIGEGVKIDNQVHVAHNVHIGAHTAIAGCVGIAGSTHIGARCTIGGAAVILDHLSIVDDVHVTAGSLVTGSIPAAGVYSSSLKAQPAEKWRRNAARLRHLDELARRLQDLEAKLASHDKEPKA